MVDEGVLGQEYFLRIGVKFAWIAVCEFFESMSRKTRTHLPRLHGDTIQMTQASQLRPRDCRAASGGCQCGAVRYKIGRLGKASICHCRMCQKAFGGYFAPLVEAFDVEWTRGERSVFHSSDSNWRGFCSACGTPLTYEFEGHLEIAIGTLDEPDIVQPEVQVNPRYRRECFERLSALPEKPAEQQDADNAWNATVRSNQHPDHDT